MIRNGIWWLGLIFVVCGLVAQQVAIWKFTATSNVPLILEWIGGLGFWFWWLPIIVGVILMRLTRRKPGPRVAPPDNRRSR